MKTIVNDIYGNPVGEMDVPVVERSIVEEWEMMRGKRNFLLAQTDIYGLSDRRMTAEMKNYRQNYEICQAPKQIQLILSGLRNQNKYGINKNKN